MSVARQLAGADLKAELARLELEWERRQRKIQVHGRHGRLHVPDRFGAVYFFVLGLGLTALIVVRNPERIGFNADFLPLLALVASPMLAGVWWWHKATVYKRELAAYRAERARLEQKLASTSGP